MYERANRLVLPVLADSFLQKKFANAPMTRSKEPEIFTFEEAVCQEQRNAPVRHRKARRVMYPTNVRMYLPPAEKSPVKRLLLILCFVVLLQIFAEESYEETLSEAGGSISDLSKEDFVNSRSQFMPLDYANERDVQMENFVTELRETLYVDQEKTLDQHLDTTCTNWDSEVTGPVVQSSRTCYVMGLIYPVYRRLGKM